MDMYEFKEIKEVTDLTTWTINDFLYSNAPNPVREFSNRVIVREAVNVLLRQGGFPGWEVILVTEGYTKNHPEAKEAGKFYLELTIWLKRKIDQREGGKNEYDLSS